mmetsp:Transcript_21177/g.50019  ORF Transcript_21177/g.50019 Transcript_21177/m.50019 type:complete len:290 (-) Transcript_21177:3279-4148(-)
MSDRNSSTKSSAESETNSSQTTPIVTMSSGTDHGVLPPTSPTPGDSSNAAEGDLESNKRSERKRRREKQRRSDLSNAFDELAAFTIQVEPGSGEDDSDKKGKRRKSSDAGGEDSAGITRLDLIGRALRIMKRLYRENEERKRVISTLEGRGGVPNDNVIVMVPTLAPSGDDPPQVARAAYPNPYHHSNATSPYYASAAASNLQASATIGNGVGVDHRGGLDYSMPPPHHAAAYASHWGGYGGRQPQQGLPHHLSGAVRLPHPHVAAARAQGGIGADGRPVPHIPPGSQH